MSLSCFSLCRKHQLLIYCSQQPHMMETIRPASTGSDVISSSCVWICVPLRERRTCPCDKFWTCCTAGNITDCLVHHTQNITGTIYRTSLEPSTEHRWNHLQNIAAIIYRTSLLLSTEHHCYYLQNITATIYSEVRNLAQSPETQLLS